MVEYKKVIVLILACQNQRRHLMMLDFELTWKKFRLQPTAALHGTQSLDRARGTQVYFFIYSFIDLFFTFLMIIL